MKVLLLDCDRPDKYQYFDSVTIFPLELPLPYDHRIFVTKDPQLALNICFTYLNIYIILKVYSAIYHFPTYVCDLLCNGHFVLFLPHTKETGFTYSVRYYCLWCCNIGLCLFMFFKLLLYCVAILFHFCVITITWSLY